jgi:uncharacterized caspase-like protein
MLVTRALSALAATWLIAIAPALAQERVALVIGNSGYQHATALANPVSDAKAMSAALKDLGFHVILGTDLDKRGFDGKVRDFARALGKADAGLFFYAGHGLQVGGQNFLVPVDAKLESERDLDFEAVRLDFVQRQMELEREGKTNIVILDACRDNPLARNLARSMGTRSAAVGSGLAQVQTGVGTFIAFSTQPGNVALDGGGANSPFTAALAKHVGEPGRSLTAVMVDVRKDVLAATGGRQVPWDHSSLTGEFYFHLASAPQMMQKPAPLEGSEVEALKERMRSLEAELQRKSGQADTEAIVRLAQLRERSRQISEAIRDDQNRLFELMRNRAAQTEISKVHMQMARRGQELGRVKEELAKLETEVGTAPK